VRERLWSLLGRPLYRSTFHNWYGLRRAILRLFGASIHPRSRPRATAEIASPWNLTLGEESSIGDHARVICHAPVSIGRFCTVSQYAHLCSGGHRQGDLSFALQVLPIAIGDGVWIAADAYVGPGVTLGDGSIIGARASVHADVPARTVVTGAGAHTRSDGPNALVE